MSFVTWHTYGYGVQISDLKNVSIDKVLELIRSAPDLSKRFEEWIRDCEITEPTMEDLEEFDNDYCIGLATILRSVIEECEGISLTACTDYEGNSYLLYAQTYPWWLTEKEKSFTEADIQSLFVKYLSRITDDAITVDYYDPENGG